MQDSHPLEHLLTPLVIGVTSHRNIPAREIESITERVRDLFAQLQHGFPALPLVVLSALAEGGDQLVAKVALDAGARLIAPLPLPPDLYAEDFADATARADFGALCDQATVIELPLLRGQTRAAVAVPGVARDRQYAQAGVYVASHCHILLAIWDGKASDRLGGTAQVVSYHLSGVLPGLIERRRSARHVFDGGDERLAYHIACSREKPDGAPDHGLQPLDAWWRTATHTVAAAHGMPAPFKLMFARMAEFNTECARYASTIDDATRTRLGATREKPTTGIDRLFDGADWLAVHFCQRVLLAMRSTYTLAGLMGIAFMCYSDLPAQDYMIFVFLLLFALGASVALLAQRRGWHRKYLDYRALAEGLRVQSYWRRAGISVTGDPEFAHDNFMQKQDVELGWIRNVMRAAGLPAPGQSAPPAADTPEACAALAGVIAEWIGEPGKSGQLAYYERKAIERTHLHHLTELIGAISLRGGVAISVFLAIFVFSLSQNAKTALVAIMAVLSITAAVREAYAYRKADKELIKQYRFMQRIFASAYAALQRTHDTQEQREILRALGEAALAEHAEWTLMHRERQVETSKL